MEYFTRQITLQDRLKQHECQLYPLFGSCLELRDDSPEGLYQGSPLDLSCNSLTHRDQYSSSETISTNTPSGTDRLTVIPTHKSSLPKTISVYKSSSPGTSTQTATDKSLSPRNKLVLTNHCVPVNSDMLNVKSALEGNDERCQLSIITTGEKFSTEKSLQLGDPTQGIVPTRLRVQCNSTGDLNPLLTEMLECENPTVSAVSKILEHGEHVNESNSSSDPDNTQCKSTISNDDHERKQSDSTMTSNPEHKSIITNEQENKQCTAPMAIDKLPISSNPAIHGVTNLNHERMLKNANSRKRRRFLSGAMHAFLSNRKKQNHSKLCPNVNVADFADQCTHDRSGLKLVNESNLSFTQHATSCRKPRTDVNVSMPRVDINHKDISSQGHYGNQTPYLGHYRNQTSRGQYENQTPFQRHYNNLMSSQGYNRHELPMPEELPVAINTSAKQLPPPSSLLINGVSSFRANLNVYPCSLSNTQPQELMKAPSTYSKVQQKQQHEKQYCPQQTKETVYPSSDANKHPMGLPTPLDLSAKREHLTHDSASVSEETRIKEISNNLRLKLLEQSSNVPHSCPGICLGHAVDATKVKRSSKCIPSSRHTGRLPIDQTSIIIHRQVLLNLDYQHLLSSDEEKVVDPDRDGCITKDTETKSNNRTVRCVDHQGSGNSDHKATDQDRSSAIDHQRSSATDQDRSSATDHQRSSATDQDRSSATDHQRSSATDQDSSSATDQERSLANDQSSATDQERSSATDQQRSLDTDQESRNLSPGIDRKTRKGMSLPSTAQVREQIVTSVSTHMDGSQDQSSMAWNLSVSKTVGLHSDCNNCKACRRIFAKLSIPPIE